MRKIALSIALGASMSATAAACPAPDPTAGVDIYPTAAILPANLLRLYVYFSRRMATGDILDHIAMVDAEGQVIDGVFLSNSYDLWSPDRRRLTLLLDPGRVKTGLSAHHALGRALAEGQSYMLRVYGTAPDAGGCPLGVDTEYRFTAGPPDLDPPAPAGWIMDLPAAGSRAPLQVDLGSPHDHLSLAYRLRVHDAHGNLVPGALALGPQETTWLFTPSAPWKMSGYHLTIDPRLEDLAGNRPGQLFDQPIGLELAQAELRLRFLPSAD